MWKSTTASIAAAFGWMAASWNCSSTAPQKARELLDSFCGDPTTTETPRKCPICDKKMAKILVGPSETPVRIDRCRRSHGLWFDRGELEDILRRGKFDEESRVLRLLADMFGRDPGTAGTESQS